MAVPYNGHEKFPFYDTTSNFVAIGKRGLRRKDGYEKASGTGIYTRDVYLPGMLYAKFMLSPYAHAKIKSLDTKAVEAYPGVRSVFRYDDPWFKTNNWTVRNPSWTWGGQREQLLTESGEVNWLGEPCCLAVCADTEQICDEALKLAKVNWEVLPFEIEPVQACSSNATILQPEVDPKTNVRYNGSTFSDGLETHGDVEKGFAASDKVVEFSWSEQETTTAATEALSCVAVWRGEFLEMWVHNQTPMRTITTIRNYFGRNHIKINLHCPYHGAQFGGENWLNYFKWFPIITCIFAERTKKAVKHIYDESYFRWGGYEHGTHNIKVGFNKDGKINAIQDKSFRADAEINAKLWKGTCIPNTLGVTQIPYVNRPAVVCYRHGMRSCGLWNMIFFRVAAETGLDPHAVASKNDGAHGNDAAWVNENVKKKMGFTLDNPLDKVFTAGKEAFGWDSKYHAPGARKLANGKYHGVSMVHSIAWNPDPNQYFTAYQIGINVQRQTPLVRILARHADHGWNHESTICRVVADEIGVNYADVEFRPFDETGFDTAAGEGSAGLSRTLPMAVDAARKIRSMILKQCCTPCVSGTEPSTVNQPAQFPGLTPDQLELKESVVFEKAKPDNKKTLQEVASYQWSYYQPFIAFSGAQRHNFEVFYLSRQATYVEVEVDPETGFIEIKTCVNSNDVGKAIDPDGVNAQQYGGTYMGLSHSRQDGKVYDPMTGAVLNDDLIDYKWFSFNDITGPMIQRISETPLGYTPYGQIGCSESLGAVNSTQLAGAVYNAIGKWITDFPITPDKVLKALGKI